MKHCCKHLKPLALCWIDDEDECMDKDSQNSHTGYEIGEFYYFRHPKLRNGFQPAQGGIIQRADILYPEAWKYFQSSEGKQLCTTEEEWQAMVRATWATLADGTEIGWNGIGGAPFYVQDLNMGTLRLPDLRGMYAESAGFDGLEVGGVHGDMIRNLTGGYKMYTDITEKALDTSVIYPNIFTTHASYLAHNVPFPYGSGINFDASRGVPTGNANKPRAYGVNGCVYLGKPTINKE